MTRDVWVLPEFKDDTPVLHNYIWAEDKSPLLHVQISESASFLDFQKIVAGKFGYTQQTYRMFHSCGFPSRVITDWPKMQHEEDEATLYLFLQHATPLPLTTDNYIGFKYFQVATQSLTWFGGICVPKTMTWDRIREKWMQKINKEKPNSTQARWSFCREDAMGVCGMSDSEELTPGSIVVIQDNFPEIEIKNDTKEVRKYLNECIGKFRFQTLDNVTELSFVFLYPFCCEQVFYWPVQWFNGAQNNKTSVLQTSPSLSNMFNQPTYADVVFRCASESSSSSLDCSEEGQHPIWAHKVILSSSPYFDKLFSGGFSESKTSAETKQLCLTVPREEFEGTKMLLEYLYGRPIPIHTQPQPCKTLLELFLLADKFLVRDLRDACTDALTRYITLDSCFDILGLCLKCHPSGTLKDACMDFIRQHAKEVASKPAFQDLCRTSPEMVSQLFTAVCDAKSVASQGRSRSRSRSPCDRYRSRSRSWRRSRSRRTPSRNVNRTSERRALSRSPTRAPDSPLRSPRATRASR